MNDRDGEDEAGAEWRFEAPGGSAGERLDRCLPGFLEERGCEVSRAALQQWIRDGAVSVNGRAVKPRHAVAAGDEIVVRMPDRRFATPQPEAIEVTVLHEDDDIVVVDKQPGLVVHPGSGNADGTLVNALLHHCGGVPLPAGGRGSARHRSPAGQGHLGMPGRGEDRAGLPFTRGAVLRARDGQGIPRRHPRRAGAPGGNHRVAHRPPPPSTVARWRSWSLRRARRPLPNTA